MQQKVKVVPYNSTTVYLGGRAATLTLRLYFRSRKSGHDSISSNISPIASKVDTLSPEIATNYKIQLEAL
jgi:hypothetical protein